MRALTHAGEVGVTVLLVLFAVGTASADIHVVSPDGLGAFPTIQDAVDAALDDDIIELTNGTFTGDGNRDVVVPSRPITIRSQSGNYMDCIVDCEGSARVNHRGFHFQTTVGTGNATLEGVGIINGYTMTSGGGIWVEGANPTIVSCAVEFCTADGSMTMGGGIYVNFGAHPFVSLCLVSGNTAVHGGGIAVEGTSGTFLDCDIKDNTATSVAGGVYIAGYGVTQFAECEIVDNEAAIAGGIWMSGSNTHILCSNISRNTATAEHSGGIWLQGGTVGGCTIVKNSAAQGAGGVYCHGGTGVLATCLIAFTENGYGVGASEGNAPSMNCCDVYGNAGGDYDAEVGDQTGLDNNFSDDPGLCGLAYGDYRLLDTSPCLSHLSPCDEPVGCFGEGCNNPVEETSWGRVKGLWR